MRWGDLVLDYVRVLIWPVDAARGFYPGALIDRRAEPILDVSQRIC